MVGFIWLHTWRVEQNSGRGWYKLGCGGWKWRKWKKLKATYYRDMAIAGKCGEVVTAAIAGGLESVNARGASVNGSVSTAVTPCAACKLLRRKCAEECPFSPYFSPLEPHKFASVHKVFGASNVSKMLMLVPESQRADTASSLVYEANARLRDPVYGCMGAISALQQQAQLLQVQLDAAKAELFRYKIREAALLATAMSSTNTPPPLPCLFGNPYSNSPSSSSCTEKSFFTTSTCELPVGSPTSTSATTGHHGNEHYWSLIN